MPAQFKNEPFTNFSKPANKKGMEKALAKVRKELGKEYPLVIGGEAISTSDKLYSYNPAQPSEVVGIFSKANTELATKAIETAAKSFETWEKCSCKKTGRIFVQSRSADAQT